MSVNVAAFFSSYMIAITLLLHKRLRNDLEKDNLRWGPWHMGPVFGPFVNVVGLAYTTTTMFCNQPNSLSHGPSSLFYWPGAYLMLPARSQSSICQRNILLIRCSRLLPFQPKPDPGEYELELPSLRSINHLQCGIL